MISTLEGCLYRTVYLLGTYDNLTASYLKIPLRAFCIVFSRLPLRAHQAT